MPLAALTFLLALPTLASAAGPGPRSTAGDFDFYVLALSWSPAYCANAKSDELQCGIGKAHRFIVHGLWPQYDRGWPEFCAAKRQSIPRRLVDTMLDIMPSRRLVYHEWDKHGTCSGLKAADYFALLREAAEKVEVPANLESGDGITMTAPGAIERAFMDANPSLEPDMIAVQCERREMSEIRICMNRDLDFVRCPEVNAGGCRLGTIRVRPAGDADRAAQ